MSLERGRNLRITATLNLDGQLALSVTVYRKYTNSTDIMTRTEIINPDLRKSPVAMGLVDALTEYAEASDRGRS